MRRGNEVNDGFREGDTVLDGAGDIVDVDIECVPVEEGAKTAEKLTEKMRSSEKRRQMKMKGAMMSSC